MKVFTPILKTKRLAEYRFIKLFKDSFDDSIFPYLEINKPLDNGDVKKYLNILKGKFFISELISIEGKSFDEFRDEMNELCLYSPGISINVSTIINNNYEMDGVINLVNYIHANDKIVSLRVSAGFELSEIKDLISLLNENDYFIVDLKEDDYLSIFLYESYIKEFVRNKKILVFTEDRKNIPASKFCENGFNEDFTPSVIQAIKDDEFTFDGFGSYCSARNNQYEGGGHPFKGKALLLLYSFKRNQYYSFVTKEAAPIAQIYNKLPKELLSNAEAKKEVDTLLSTSEITNEIYNSFIKEDKFASYKSILIGMSQYFEEILNNLMNVH